MAYRATVDPTGQQVGEHGSESTEPAERDGLAWSDWMPQAGIMTVAMESTGEYWELVDNLSGGCRPASFPQSSSGGGGV
jgi:hypothetical protein